MTTPSEILDEAVDETEACPECWGSGHGQTIPHDTLGNRAGVGMVIGQTRPCTMCHGSRRVPKPKAEQPSAEVVERGARIVYEDERTRISWPTETWEQLE